MDVKTAAEVSKAEPRRIPQLEWKDLAPVLWIGLLLMAGYVPVLTGLVEDWMNDEDMGHGFFVPPLAAYIAWTKRTELRPARRNWLGLAVVLLSMIQLWVATLGAELFLARSAFVIAVAGSTLFLCGMENLRILAFPLVLLVFMIPLPAIVYNQITFPLQLLASRVAEVSLSLVGIPVLREGNILELASQRLSVVEACSGIRSLLSLSFLSLVYAHFFDRNGWMKIALLVVTIPVAVVANASRVSMTGILSEWSPDLAQGFFHLVEGWIVFLFALLMMMAAHQLISRLWEHYRKPDPGAGGAVEP
jgi:exosortase